MKHNLSILPMRYIKRFKTF